MKIDTIIKNIKNAFTIQPAKLAVRYDTCDVEINLRKQNNQGIISNTFYKLQTPEFTPDTNCDENGLKITTLIDKKTGKPARAFVAAIAQSAPNAEKFCIMVEDRGGQITVGNKRLKTVGEIYFYVNKAQQMIMPKFEKIFINGELCEKVCSYMEATGNKDYLGIGTRLHQIRVERMLQHNLGNSCIVADGNSFPFHYSMGYRLTPATRPIEDSIKILYQFSGLNNKPPKENAKYLFAERQNGNYVINWSATMEHFLCDYYNNGGAPLDYLMPNMFLTVTSLKQYIAMIQRQPILY